MVDKIEMCGLKCSIKSDQLAHVRRKLKVFRSKKKTKKGNQNKKQRKDQKYNYTGRYI